MENFTWKYKAVDGGIGSHRERKLWLEDPGDTHGVSSLKRGNNVHTTIHKLGSSFSPYLLPLPTWL
jgi:hypothetical protein